MATDHSGDYRTVRLPQGAIRYREYGAGEPIVFAHGLLVNGELWRKVVPLLAGRYRCIVPDWPLGSHEEPMNADADLSPPGLAKLIADFLVALDLRSVTLVANDTGGAISQLVATGHPERIGRLVLTNCDCFDNFLPLAFRPLQWGAHVPGFLFLIAQTMRWPALPRLLLAPLTRRPPERAVTDAYVRPVISSHAVRRDVGKILKGISPRYTLAAAQQFAEFRRPVLLAWAPEDHFFPFAHAQRLSRLFPDARLKTIADSLTFIPEDQPERLAGLIADFMNEDNGEETQQPQTFSAAEG
ncbi:MAG TPA: alpha/beta hydrolase [Blastocatellia bacterium]|nr:alpha/beta hydrolase [Blastocatellia bacterium]